ncbi:hypothetical protein GCM10010233_65090 [Streptomyces pseudogriseolus]|nr:hypothetical protein GCM10010233_65090 [Streptomyces gancidicus]
MRRVAREWWAGGMGRCGGPVAVGGARRAGMPPGRRGGRPGGIRVRGPGGAYLVATMTPCGVQPGKGMRLTVLNPASRRHRSCVAQE